MQPPTLQASPLRLAVIGSREYPRLGLVDELVDVLAPWVVVVSGGARGVDLRAELRAKGRGLKVDCDRFRVPPAEWRRVGPSAGPRRNERMLATVAGVAAFWTGQRRGSGTFQAVGVALGRGLPVRLTDSAGRVSYPTREGWGG